MKLAIVDYGLGNLYSVRRAFHAVGAEAKVSDSPDELIGADRLVLPGVGAFGDGMAGLRARGLTDVVREFAATGRPVLGICLGTQLLMTEGHEFGRHEGLGIVPGTVVPFDHQAESGCDKIPHVGWNSLLPGPEADQGRWRGGILRHVEEGMEMYFTHSYVLAPEEPGDQVAITNYAGQTVCAVIERDNIRGCQFHPEKSGPAGLRILKRFLEV